MDVISLGCFEAARVWRRASKDEASRKPSLVSARGFGSSRDHLELIWGQSPVIGNRRSGYCHHESIIMKFNFSNRGLGVNIQRMKQASTPVILALSVRT